MKFKVFTSVMLSIFISASAMAQMGDKEKRPSPAAKTEFTVNRNNIVIDYSQPAVKGREIFGDLVPYGKVWRTGANEATTITFSKNATINGKEVKAGTYAVFTIPGKKSWTIILNSEAKQWGAYKYDESKNALTFEVNSTENKMTERMTFSNDKEGNVMLDWATTRVSFSIK